MQPQALLLLFGFAALGLPAYLGALMLPSWRWVAVGFAVAAGLGLVHSFLSQALNVPLYVILSGTLVFLSLGLVVRSLILLSRLRGGAALTVAVVGFALGIAAPYLWVSGEAMWRNRPLSEACRSATFDVRIGETHFLIPNAPLFSVHFPQRGSTFSSFSLATQDGRRMACAAYGRSPLTAQMITVRASPFDAEGYCDNPPSWAQPVCSTLPRRQRGEIEFPRDVFVSAADPSAGNRMTTEEQSRRPPGPADHERRFFRSAKLTSDGTPLTFACRSSGAGQATLFCRASYRWRKELFLSFNYVSDPNRVVEIGDRLDDAVRRLLEGLLKP